MDEISPTELQEHSEDYPWLDKHIGTIFDQTHKDLQRQQSANRGIEMLNLIMPYALTRRDFRQWEGPLQDALLYALDLKDDELQIQIFSHLGSYFLQSGQCKTASGAFEKALSRAERDVSLESSLLARIGMLRTEAVLQTSDIHEFIRETRAAAKTIKPYRLLARLHYALALAYNHQAETVRALGHGQVALAYWFYLENKEEIERAALALAETCRVADRFGQAARYLELAYPGTVHVFQHAVHEYQQGSILLQQEKPAEAEPHLQQALQAFRALEFTYQIGGAHHALGLAQTKLGHYKAAFGNLRQALVIWQQLEIPFQQANVLYGMGFLEERSGRPAEACLYYTHALEISEKLPESPMVLELRKELQEHLAEVKPHTS